MRDQSRGRDDMSSGCVTYGACYVAAGAVWSRGPACGDANVEPAIRVSLSGLVRVFAVRPLPAGASLGRSGREATRSELIECGLLRPCPHDSSRDRVRGCIPKGTPPSALRHALQRYLPWLRSGALHPSAPGATRIARIDQSFPSKLCITWHYAQTAAVKTDHRRFFAPVVRISCESVRSRS
jgi:hypothetical protein